ncbi:MFS transporter [Sinosporangium siamense]|uniref:Major facilitator superfamily (MFS) profile domain-containing protein n=1 Tax=Sinosporangium siamense TaxID=1367973 RepID=A0A919RJU5_9ACTN|nr:MFS transporter [Sinosporangium siamense]GII95098.1 hypothetical protein Ssi02_53290 [Sinosporangium siamense]
MKAPPLRHALREHSLTLYPVSALGLLLISNSFAETAFTVLGPDLRNELGMTTGELATAMSVQFLALTVAPMTLAFLSGNRPRRAALSIATGLVWSLATAAVGLTGGMAGLMLVLLVFGLANGSTVALHSPLLVDTYPPAVRARVLTLYGAASAAAYVVAPLLVSALTGWLDLGWRAVFLTLGGLATLMCLCALGLRDPGVGRFEPAADARKGLWPVVRSLLRIPTVRRLMAGFAVFGALQVPVSTLVSVHLEERWDLTADARGLYFTCAAVAMLITLVVSGRFLDGMFQTSPGRVAVASGVTVAGSALAYTAGILAPALPLALALFLAAAAAQAHIIPATQLMSLSVISPAHRAHASALFALAIAVGGLFGAGVLAGFEQALGAAGSVAAIAVPGLLAAFVIASARRTLPADLLALRAAEPEGAK